MMSVDPQSGPRSVLLTVSGVVDETPDARSIIFEVPAEAVQTFQYRPGQFLTLRIPSDRSGSVARCYSLASSPFTDAALKVTVKRTSEGFASNWLCDNVSMGQAIESLPPSGRFTPDNFDEDLLLLAAGSGITPVISILKSALSEGACRIALIYANRDENSVIFVEELRKLSEQYDRRLSVLHWLETVQGRPSPQQLADIAAPFRDRRAFVCGPAPFMEVVNAALAANDVPRERVHAEVFVSLSGDPFEHGQISGVTESEVESAATVHIELDGATHQHVWLRRQTLVEMLLAEGIDVPYSCREGVCGSCACTVLQGKVDMDKAEVLAPEDIENGYILACQARPASDHIHIEF
ncbi:ferredoxin--NADP reductase [Rhodococcus sp. G-MC3]|uniref:ferredoxin--NADP reductase n=1 Tax=Rhodococcus sp. G-MC3 TaxID=3046209 RepID=UPI0024BBC25D|nr:ferredoxin--NADP reductase [Rhodococcus sp. G-MC3]MDJ0394876.1 ferredoxin--NADP reductase [Rhodococcus sp. G-MC3]